ncbi:hypothetical protein JCM14036_29100 [Desulfotomaculum defluvii]
MNYITFRNQLKEIHCQILNGFDKKYIKVIYKKNLKIILFNYDMTKKNLKTIVKYASMAVKNKCESVSILNKKI